MIALLAEQPMDVASLAESLRQTDAWTRYWLACFMRLNVVVANNVSAHRRIYRLGDEVTVKRKGVWLTFRFPPLNGSMVEVTLKASSLPIDLAGRKS